MKVNNIIDLIFCKFEIYGYENFGKYFYKFDFFFDN